MPVESLIRRNFLERDVSAVEPLPDVWNIGLKGSERTEYGDLEVAVRFDADNLRARFDRRVKMWNILEVIVWENYHVICGVH